MDRLREAWRRAVTAELCWTNPDGTPAAIAVTPLLRGSSSVGSPSAGSPSAASPAAGSPSAGTTVCAAVPYSRAREVAELRAAGEATFAVTDSRSLPARTGTDSSPATGAGVAATGTVRIVDDLDGELFLDELLDQELVKYPPSRTLADSVLLRRENWWWLPRIVVELAGPAPGAGHPGETPLPARTDPARHALLVTTAAGAAASTGVPELRSVDLGADSAPSGAAPSGAAASDVLGVRDLAGEPLPAASAGALVFGYDYTMPDLERWETWSRRGGFDGGHLAVEARTGSPGEDLRTLGLLARTRRHRALAKACRTGLRAAQRHLQPTP
ncbi:hypothetical protein GCM10009676_30760 [Prauserella halophila]|uniref:Uncharacterized protein n=1 Tax=Prauserella halophila TaxID=185641 RepID=A0ABN1WEK4_9PSEU|nr:hypothetical protein [Prauserella halophila]MCP2234703.1 hypothetical protein [Prauserella halophila]